MLAYAAYLTGDFEECVSFASQLEPTPRAFVTRLQAYQQNLLGFAYCELGKLDEAQHLLQEVLEAWQELGDLLFADFCRLNLARVTWKRGQLGQAWLEYQSVIAAFGRWNDVRGKAYAVEGLGRVAADLGRFTESARLLGAAQRLRDSLGLRRDFADDRAYAASVATCRNALDTVYDSEWQAGYGIPSGRVEIWVAGLEHR